MPSTICVHCAVLPERTDNHTVVAVCDDSGTPDRAWFYEVSIRAVYKFADELVPGDGALGDWEYRRHNDTELMVLKANGTQYIWKLTNRYHQNHRFGVWVD
jgi:hypothetical protein